MNISDLELVEVVSETSAIEGGSHYQFDFVSGYIGYSSYTVGLAIGNVAVGDAAANAYGFDTFSKAATSTLTTPFYSGSGAYSVSVTGY